MEYDCLVAKCGPVMTLDDLAMTLHRSYDGLSLYVSVESGSGFGSPVERRIRDMQTVRSAVHRRHPEPARRHRKDGQAACEAWRARLLLGGRRLRLQYLPAAHSAGTQLHRCGNLDDSAQAR